MIPAYAKIILIIVLVPLLYITGVFSILESIAFEIITIYLFYLGAKGLIAIIRHTSRAADGRNKRLDRELMEKGRFISPFE